MTANIVGSPTNITFNNGTPSGTFTPAGGATNRIVAIVSYQRYDGARMSALSVGGNAFSKKIYAEDATSNIVNAEIWESAGFSGSGMTVSVTMSSAWKDCGITFICVSGAGAIVTTNTAAHNASTDLTAAVSCAVGDLIIAAASSDRAGSSNGTWANSFTSDLSTASPNSLGSFAHAHKIATSTTETAQILMALGSASFSAALAVAVIPASATPASLSGPTPSGTLGTTTTATIGATTDQNTGTLYTILSTTQADVTGASAANIKAGQIASGSAAPFSGNSAVSTTSPNVNITGLSGNTTYYYAVVQNNSNGDSNVINTGSFTTANPAAALSSGTPSGTIGTQTTASIGATTTQNSGTVYAIVSTVQGDVTGASAANIKAGQKSGGSAAPFSGNATVTTTSPSVAITGLTAGTLYYFAIIQNNGNGDSNIINTGSFTTAAATSSFSIPIKSAAGVLLSGVTLRFWTRLTEDGAAVDGGSAGIPIICGSDGVFAISTLTIAKGAGFLYWSNPADPYKRHYIPYTFY